MDLTIKIVAQGASAASAAIQGITGALRNQADQVRAYSATLQNGAAAFQQMLGAAGALLGLRQLGLAVRAAQDSAVALAQLRQTLITTGQSAAGVEEAFLAQAAALERLTGYEDERVLQVQRLLLAFKATAEQVRELTPLVMDLAAQMGTEPVAAARLLGQALDGQAVGLGRLNLTAKNIPDLITQLNAGFGGQAAALHRARGPLGETVVLLNQTREALGALIVVPVNAFLETLNRGLDATREQFERFAVEQPGTTAFLRELASVAGQLAAAFGPGTLGLAAVLLGVTTSLRVLTPLVNLLRVAFFAVAGPLQAMTRGFGLMASLAAEGRLVLDGAAAVATRFGAALSLAGGAVAALGAAFLGFELGGVIGQIKVLGETIEDRLTRAILRAQLGWLGLREMMGVGPADFSAQVETLLAAIADRGPLDATAPAAAAVGGSPAATAQAASAEKQLQYELARLKVQQSLATDTDEVLFNLREQLKVAQDLDSQAIQSAAAEADKGQFTEAHLAALTASLKTYEQVLATQREIDRIEEQRSARAYLGGFEGQLGLQSGAMFNQLGTAAANAAAIVTSTLGAAFSGISDQISKLILGTVTWGQALANIGRSIVTQLVQAIVQFFVAMAARALLTALFGAAITKAAAAGAAAAWASPAILANTATMGTASAVGVSATAASMASAPLIAAAGMATGAGFAAGGLVPAGERMIRVNEQGPEFVMNASATARNLPLLEAMNSGGAGASAAPLGAESPLRVVIVDNRRDADELARDPRYRNLLIDLASRA